MVYGIYFSYRDYPEENYDPWEQEVVDLVTQSRKEYFVLLKIFREEQEDFFKIQLGRILAELGERSIVPYL